MWYPLFHFLEKYLESGLFDQIYLSTDYSNSYIPNTIKLLEKNKEWSDRVLDSLNHIESENLFIILEDYIPLSKTHLKDPYKVFNDLNLDYLRVSFKTGLPNNFIYKLPKYKKYNISLQPGFWRKKFLREILKTSETPWEFEIMGSFRNIFTKSKCYSLGCDFFNQKKIPFPCFFTGSIVKGKLINSEFLRFKNELNNIDIERDLIPDDEIPYAVRLNKWKIILEVLKKGLVNT